MIRVRRALLSVSDKTGILGLAETLFRNGVEMISTGGTGSFLRDAGFPITDISSLTGQPECFDGRVKTLSWAVAGAILFDRARHGEEARRLGVFPIDLVVCNLYPFRQAWNAKVPHPALVEEIDIGGVTLIRAAAKNAAGVTVVVDPADYEALERELLERDGKVSEPTRRRLMRKAFHHTAEYDALIAGALDEMAGEHSRRLSFTDGRDLRYGENPHQRALVFRQDGEIWPYTVLQGKELSYTNLIDLHGAVAAVQSLRGSPAGQPAGRASDGDREGAGRAAQTHSRCAKAGDNAPAATSAQEPTRVPGARQPQGRNGYGCVVVKHANPCGLATAATQAEAFELAWNGDPVSAFGSIIAFNRPLESATVARFQLDQADRSQRRFIEIVAAPGFEPGCLDLLAAAPNLRAVVWPGPAQADWTDRLVGPLLLRQEADRPTDEPLVSCTRTLLPEEMAGLARFGLTAVALAASNTIVIVRPVAPRRAAGGAFQLLGLGAGQPNRVASTRLAIESATANLAREAEHLGVDPATHLRTELGGAILVSDAFFPFPDSVESAAAAGIRFLVQPGGSRRDAEVIARADELGLAMAFTGRRHFRH